MSIYYIPINITDYDNNYLGTRTEINLWTAFIGESIARNKYSYFSSIARKAGYEQMAEVFSTIAENEKEHAKIWLKELNQLKSHPENLRLAADGEHYEWTSLYPKMAEIALDDGFHELSQLFLKAADIEKNHEEKFRSLIRDIDCNEVFARSGIVFWECRNCGHIEVAQYAPITCPVCNHPQGFFQIYSSPN